MKHSGQKKFKAWRKYHLCHNDRVYRPVPEKFKCEQIGENELGQKVFAFKPSQKYIFLTEQYESIRNQYNP